MGQHRDISQLCFSVAEPPPQNKAVPHTGTWQTPAQVLQPARWAFLLPSCSTMGKNEEQGRTAGKCMYFPSETTLLKSQG